MTQLLRAPSICRRLVAAASLGLLLAGCGKQTDAPAGAASAPAASSRVYIVGTDAAYAPFEFQNEKGEIVGFDIDVLSAIAKQAGLEIKFVNTPWEGIFNALQQGDRDILVSAVSMTDARRETMDFAGPYFDAYQLIAVKQGSPIARFQDLKTLKVGVQNGTTGDDAVTRLQGNNSPNVKRFESTPLALKEMESGGVDAVVADNGVIVNYVVNNPGAKFKTVTDPDFKPEHYGIAVKKGNAALVATLNKGLAAIQADGSYAALHRKYFGDAPAPVAAAASGAAASAASQ